MASLFLFCAILGGAVLILQLLLGIFGADHHHGDLTHDAAEGMNLLTVRSLSGGVAFFGITGSAVLAARGGAFLATLAGLLVGGGVAVGVAALMRRIRSLESDGTVHLENAVGHPARVYVPVGPQPRVGKVLLTLQERLMEVPAVSLDGELPTGTSVTVVGITDDGAVEVVRTPETGV